MRNELKSNFKKIFKKGDLILLAVFLVAVILTIVFAVGGDDDVVQIFVDGQLKYEIGLDANTEISLLDGEMTVVVRDGKAWVEYSDCAEQLCVNNAPVSSSGGMIVCLPNKVVVKVVEKEVDAIT